MRYNEYKDSAIPWIGHIPSHWNIQRGKNVLTLLERPVEDADEVITCFRDGEVTLRKNRREEGFTFSLQEVGYQGIEPGDLVVHGMDGFAGAIGVSDSRGKATPVLNVLDSPHNKRYLMYYLRTAAYKDVFMALSTGIRVRSCDLRWNKLSVFPFLLPSRAEQDQIVKYIDNRLFQIDNIINETKIIIEKYKSWKASVVYETVTKGLNTNVQMKDSHVEWLGEIPHGWKTGLIGSLYTLRNTKVSDAEYPPLSVTMKGVVPQLETVAKTDAHDDRKLVLKGDFAINSRSDRRGSCGISEYDGSVSLINTILTPRGNMHPRYYNWLFHTAQFADEYYKNGHGIVNDLWTTRWNELKRITIPIPTLEEQANIADFLDMRCAKIDAIVLEKQALISELESYRKAIVFEVVTGKRKVV